MLGMRPLLQRRRRKRLSAARENLNGRADVRRQQESYESLKTAARYQQQQVKLLQADFVIADGMSFYYSFAEIFAKEIYKFQCPSHNPRIIDCGANYGTSVAYFKQLYPHATLIAVEADPEVFQLLQRNIVSLGLTDVELVHAAVSDREGFVNFFCEGADSGRIQHDANGDRAARVATVQLDQLIGDATIDFLKMDIEGAETDVIAASRRLAQVRQLFIEYHGFRGQPQRLAILLERLTEAGFRYYIHSQFCSPRPLVEAQDYLGMDLQLNIFCLRDELVESALEA